MKSSNKGRIFAGSLNWPVALALGLATQFAYAGAQTDGTTGAVQALSGHFTIPQALGTVNGGNLFHSFQHFSVNAGESATFTTSSALQNVISRVTGGTVSTINGLLQLSPASGSAPNFYFINPAGVVFGTGAVLDVPAGFHVSTASYLKFENGNFYADPARTSTLSSAPPEAFGFLSAPATSIVVKEDAEMRVEPGQPISLIGGDIEINSSIVNSQGGEIRVVAMGSSTQEVGLDGGLPAAYGRLDILNWGRVQSSGSEAMHSGKISVSAGDIQIGNQGNFGRNSIVSSALYGTGNAGNIEIAASGTLSILNGSSISSSTYTAGQAGTVTIVAGDMVIDGQGNSGSGIFSTAEAGTGNAGGVDITVRGNVSIASRGAISAAAFSAGQAGAITLKADNMTIDGQARSGTGIFNSTGLVDVTIDDTLSLIDLGRISSSTTTSTAAGSMRIAARNIMIDGQGKDTGMWSSTSGAGSAGNITVVATHSISMLNGAEISSGTTWAGTAGEVTVTADNISMDGQGYRSVISSDVASNGAGGAGAVVVTARGHLSMLDGAQISASTEGYSGGETYSRTGNAGSVNVRAGSIDIDGRVLADTAPTYSTGIFSTANVHKRGPNALGNAGAIKVSASGLLDIANGGQISSSTAGGGHAGTVLVNAANIDIDGQGSPVFTGIFSDADVDALHPAYPTGNAGAVKVLAAGVLNMTNAAQISARSFAASNPGTVRVSAATLAVSDDSFIGPRAGVTLPPADAGVKTDGSMGEVQTFSGDFTIAESFGTVKGGNLFHSFERFSLTSGESAIFTTTSPLRNVISRVTGGLASRIDGVLQLSAAAGSAPHFFFINPAGVTFGAGVIVDVPAGLHVSTGNYLKFANANYFADLARSSVLSDSAPEAFGFLGSTRALLAVESDANLMTKTYQPLSLIGGDVNINHAAVNAPGGSLRVAAIGSATLEVEFSGALPKAYGRVDIINGGSIASQGSGNIDGGSVAVSAGELVIDGQQSNNPTGILGVALDGIAKSGDLTVSATGALSIMNGGVISSSTFGSGNAGSITVEAGSVTIDGGGGQTGIFGQAYGDGNAGNMALTVDGKLSVLNRGLISSSTYASGDAGAVHIQAGEIVLDSGDAANSLATGILSISDSGVGNAGNLDIAASGKLSISNRAQISSATYTSGHAGSIKVAVGDLVIAGNNTSTGINSISDGGTGDAGNIDVNVRGLVSITSRGGIASSTYTSGAAGSIYLSAANMQIDGEVRSDTGIFSNSGHFRMPSNYPVGNGGSVEVSIGDKLELINNGKISSAAFTKGNGGSIKVVASNIAVTGEGSGIFGDTIGDGGGGNILVKAGHSLWVTNGGSISSSTRFIGNAGAVVIDAADLMIDGKGIESGIFSDAGTQGQGNSGDIDVNVSGELTLLDGGQISSATNSYTRGSAGVVTVSAQNIEIDGQGSGGETTGIISSANAKDADAGYSMGNAGSVFVSASDDIRVENGGQISTSTFGGGHAGVVQINAGNMSVSDNAVISSEAGKDSSGQTGNVRIFVSKDLLLSKALLSIKNEANLSDPKSVTPTTMVLAASTITLKDAEITASSSGNMAASNIDISYTDRMVVDPSAITTSAVNGNGGSITINGQGPLIIDRSQMTTSVTGTNNGNGGDININAPVLVLNTGFVQANTAAAAAQGGSVNINVDAVLSSGDALFIGGSPLVFDVARFGYNAIQAAAPDGVNGDIRISSPLVDLAGSLGSLSTQFIDFNSLGLDLCRIGTGSSLTPVGRGGLLPTSSGLIRP